MNNEPVAWMYACNGVWTAFSDELPPDDAYDEGTLTPLYTHPAKTLTDDEIDELVHEYNCIDDYPHEFVRACIRKAQEK